MKYFSLHAFILTGLALFLTGCYHDYDYDLTRSHDIYRMHYNYTPPAAEPEATTPAGEAPPAAAGSTAQPPQQPAVPPAAPQ
jgi:hypothetical protein